VVTPWLGSGGIEQNIEIVAPWFARKGYRIKILSWNVEEEISGCRTPYSRMGNTMFYMMLAT
jgi:hypothetical protein